MYPVLHGWLPGRQITLELQCQKSTCAEDGTSLRQQSNIRQTFSQVVMMHNTLVLQYQKSTCAALTPATAADGTSLQQQSKTQQTKTSEDIMIINSDNSYKEPTKTRQQVERSILCQGHDSQQN